MSIYCPIPGMTLQAMSSGWFSNCWACFYSFFSISQCFFWTWSNLLVKSRVTWIMKGIAKSIRLNLHASSNTTSAFMKSQQEYEQTVKNSFSPSCTKNRSSCSIVSAFSDSAAVSIQSLYYLSFFDSSIDFSNFWALRYK